MADVPPVKPWGKADKKNLQKLINTGKFDITKTTNIEYIKKVRHDHFCHRNSHNFRHNFCSYARLQELKDHLSGYH